MGVVDLATAPSGGDVALKYLDLRGSEHDLDKARQRIRREAEVLQHLAHPHIVPLLEVVESGDDVVLVMPYLAGGTLADRIRSHGPLDPTFVRYLAECLLSALAAAHRAGIVHRDIKPANVLFDPTGRPYLADFGVAALADATSGLTATGIALGTPEYMAPEQARAEPVGAAADVFSLGATLLYAATGEPPWGRGDPRVVLHRAATGKPITVPRTLPSDLRRLLSSLMEPKPERRPSAVDALGAGPGGTMVVAPVRHRRVHRRRALLMAALAAVATVAALGAFALNRQGADTVADAAPTTTTEAPTTTVACTPQPYQPCGQPAAPYTDGARCVANHADYDANATNGCEAAADSVNGSTLTANTPLAANLVPGDNIDSYPFVVPTKFSLFCDGTLDVSLTAPAGTAMQLDVVRDGRTVASAVSRDGAQAVATVDQDSCFGNDGGPYRAQVRYVDDRRSAATYSLSWSGHL
jgi:predicted Ser/Thr protein kinase